MKRRILNIEINNFLNIEKKYDLYHLEVDGVTPWTYFRESFFKLEMCKDLLGWSSHDYLQKKIMYYTDIIKSYLFLAFRRNRKYVKSSDIIFVSHPRRIKTGNFYECIYTDELVKRYGNSIVFERQYHGQHLRPVQIENIYYTDILMTTSNFFGRFHRFLNTRRYKQIYSVVQKKFADPLNEIGQTYHYSIQYDKIYESLTGIVLQVLILKKGLEKKLKKVYPQIIVETVYYSRLCMVLNELGKEMGIPTIELQHATMYSNHTAYQFPAECGEIKQFPDYVYVFSEYWKTCAHLPIPDDCIKVTGYPYFERQLNKCNRINKNEKINIIFVSQGIIGKELSMLASELCDLLDKDGYHIIYKLHPGEYVGWEKRTPWLIKENIEVVDSMEHNIYEYFVKCNFLVGVTSTAIYEGLGFGLATYIYDIGGADLLADLCEQGYASYVRSAEELYTNICTYNDNEKKDGKKFWKLNSLENICNEIDKLLKQD